ncbi:hypothetical protein BAZSYMB_SCAFFOLD00071_3 [Bathymodiolus azoricus thioautotrophic gill symbiont]|uniref:Uncharacterized protein n=1 Tax=Bathymodiolus azoricus thioautotrophic gill symbiont TaxID=235205 RepID=A0A1H6KIV5_9GAMM|nr:hypothetical protein BAZSYMB_SCAFFOLD00071_3 [Bathymodiolus azoricus thioautotrophic gill symbiont]
MGTGFEWGEFFGFDCGFGWFYFWILELCCDFFIFNNFLQGVKY